jgi:dihydroxyacetone kinase DhaKLM complex PTS-EIIA-like component DhaM
VDAPLVEGTVAAAVVASMGCELDDVAKAAEEARGANKL